MDDLVLRSLMPLSFSNVRGHPGNDEVEHEIIARRGAAIMLGRDPSNSE